MLILVPMAGQGFRFVEKGYTDPKPLIKVADKRIIEYICEMFDNESDRFVFICNDKHIQNNNMITRLPRCRDSRIVMISNHKKGPVHTTAQIFDLIPDDEEVIITYCDNPYLWDYDKFKETVKSNKSDGCILSHVGFHPHRLSSTFMAYIREENNKVIEIKEKEPYTDNPMLEHASTGTYYFKKGSYIKKYFQELMDKDINYNGEYYITLVYNLMIKDGLNVTVYPTDYVTVFGTPEEVENFEAWNKIIFGGQVKSQQDLINCYNYWKEYYDLRKS